MKVKHIDHIGNAWRVRQLSGAEIMIHSSEVTSITDVDPDGKRYGALVAQRARALRIRPCPGPGW